MNGVEEGINTPKMVLELCNHIGRNDEAVTSQLYKYAFTCLSSYSDTDIPNEEFVVQEIRQILQNESQESVQQFDLLYTNICSLNILKRRPSVLCFLLNLSKLQKGAQKWSSSQQPELERFSSSSSKTKQIPLSNNSSQESIKQIYERKYNLSSQQGSHLSSRVQSSQATTVSSTIWSKIDYSYGGSKLTGLNAVTEHDLLQDVIYSLQGIEGKYLRKEPGGLGFVLDSKISKNLTPIQKGLVERLVGTSFLHNQLKQYCDDNDKQSGIICQALIAILRDELSNYYKTVALLQASMQKQSSSTAENSELTLRRALFVMHDHHTKFEWLAYISELCNDKKGGALITAIHGFLQHGSKCAQEVAEKVLTAVCKPLYIMLSRWLLDGEINDPCNEFFINAKGITQAERLWHDKYHVREEMVPSFITMEQANKILATGKSINFLRQICKDNGQLPGRESLQKLFKSISAEALFASEQSIEFHATLENVYRETSLRVLDLLKNKYRLLEHLQSLRRYLLLGQGDFIRHLIELLAPELNKPAQDIYGHTLTAILETAIRVTNAQYEDEDTLKRLNVRFMGHSCKDLGWDVFALVYIVDGPVGTIFQPTMSQYESLFGALWKAKRMEYLLSNMRRQQIMIWKMFKPIVTLKPVMHMIHILTSEMIHFLHQTQYYFLFEVLECSWAEMLSEVNKAECLDDIIKAHSKFLSSVKFGVLLDENSRELYSYLQSMYALIINLECLQETLFAATSNELDAMLEYRAKCEQNDDFGINIEEENVEKARCAEFNKFLVCMKGKIRNIRDNYSSFVQKYLFLLSTNPNMKLQLLSVRLNFNNSYKVM